MKASISRATGLPSFKYEDLEEIEVFGQGSFGVVFTTRWRNGYRCCKKVVEAINHNNVVKFKEFCQKPYGIAIAL